MAGLGVVVFDIDGGLADMSPIADRLGPRPWRQDAWQEFFAGIGDAVVIEAGRKLATAIANLGFTTMYSTTRPTFTTTATRGWLSDHGFPAGPVLSRPNNQAACPALEIKLNHCSIVERRIRRSYLAAFVDDDPAIVTELRNHGYAGRRFDRLHDCSPASLHAALVYGPSRPEFTERKHLRRARAAYRPPVRPRQAPDALASLPTNA
ncbi:hypothetical protein [Pseudonocardia sp. TRM90224]|uniref:hypothetical protein n=1 Tax=Pseudonocardia sp. TRM90224 TaxID=2812678 RepID=UPI001E47276C|nr:hypothetical protein [Pseudonocardia sp. TRM90224]